MSHQRSRHYSVRLGEKGRIVVPAALRRELGMKPGQRLTFTLRPDGRILFRTVDQRLDDLRASLEARSRRRARRTA